MLVIVQVCEKFSLQKHPTGLAALSSVVASQCRHFYVYVKLKQLTCRCV